MSLESCDKFSTFGDRWRTGKLGLVRILLRLMDEARIKRDLEVTIDKLVVVGKAFIFSCR